MGHYTAPGGISGAENAAADSQVRRWRRRRAGKQIRGGDGSEVEPLVSPRTGRVWLRRPNGIGLAEFRHRETATLDSGGFYLQRR